MDLLKLDEQSLTKPQPTRRELREREMKLSWREWRKLQKLRRRIAAAGMTCMIMLAAAVPAAAEPYGPQDPKQEQDAKAEDAKAKPSKQESKRSWLAYSYMGAGLAADVGTTIYCQQRGGHEKNPLGVAGASALAVGASVGAIWLLDKAGHKKAAKWGAVIVGTAHLGYAVNNAIVAKGL